MDNEPKGVVISLFDYTGKMVEPWAEAGYSCYIVDNQHEFSGLVSRNITRINRDLSLPFDWFDGWKDIAFVSAFPPCDHLAVSGARWFAGKGLRKLADSINLFATAAEFCESSGAPYLIENPVSTISTYWRKPDYTFHPCDFTAFERNDNYTKKTCLWTGNGFRMPNIQKMESLGEPDDRIHKMPPGPERKNMRSATPMGFARAVFEENCRRLEPAGGE